MVCACFIWVWCPSCQTLPPDTHRATFRLLAWHCAILEFYISSPTVTFRTMGRFLYKISVAL